MPEVEVDCEKSKGVWGAPASPWATPASQPAPVSLTEVMSEELAVQLQKKEMKLLGDEGTEKARADVPDIPPDIDFDTSDDLVIAQMLQKQFDREHDMALAKEERSLNRSADSVFGFEYHTLEN